MTTAPDAATDRAAALAALTRVMKLAASGELAAALAYRGHWRSVACAEERARIGQIEEEELHHRRQLLAMLRTLGQRPSRVAEARAWLLGRRFPRWQAPPPKAEIRRTFEAEFRPVAAALA